MRFGCAGENLKRAYQVENLDARRRDEHDAPCPRIEWWVSVVRSVFQFQFQKAPAADAGAVAVMNFSGAASKVFLSASEQK